MTTLLDRRIDDTFATSQRVGIRLTRHHFGNDSSVAALLSVRNVIGSSTRQSGTTDLERYCLAKAASVGLWIIKRGTTLEGRREWSARYGSGKDSIVATLLGWRNVITLSTRQSRTRRLKGYNLIEAASVGLWIVG